MADRETVAAYPPQPSELESIPPSWPAPNGHGSRWRTLLVPSATSGCFHFGLVCLLVLIQFEFIPDEPASAYTEQLHQRYLIDSGADGRRTEAPGRDIIVSAAVADARWDKPLQYPKGLLNVEQPRVMADGEEPTARPRMPPYPGPGGGVEAETVPPEYYTTFKQHILPIFQAKCGACHADAGIAIFRQQQLMGKLDLTSVATILKGGEAGAALVPGNARKSVLHQVITNGDMPPQLWKPKLTAAEKQLILNWIETGQPGDAAAAQVGPPAPPGAETAPQAPEKEATFEGRVTAEVEGVSVTVSGAQRSVTFQYDKGNTVKSLPGDPLFFPYSGKLDGINVTVNYYRKDGKNYARRIWFSSEDFPR